MFGCYAVADGLFAIWTGLCATSRKDLMRASLVEGAVGLMIGIGALVVPQITELALVYIVATWAILTGLFEIFAIDKADHVTLNAWPYTLFGLASMIAGGLLAMFPKVGASFLMLLLGSYSLVFGVILLQLALRLHAHHQHMHQSVDRHHTNPTS
jgi:uncharacterized membrane protein HdeD (DUF308 family)